MSGVPAPLPAPHAAAYPRIVAGRAADPPSSESSSAPPAVGVFDSGVGGLTVVAALHRLDPALPLRYFADSARFPYGERPPKELADRALAIGAQFVSEGCRLLVVACNSASSAALEALRDRFDTPIVGMEPPLKPAVERSRSGRVAVLVTPTTAEGERLARLHDAHAGSSRVRTIALPGLADLVERGEVAGPRVEALLRDSLAGLTAEGVDQLALGCTHYGFLRPVLARVLGPRIEVIDAAEPVARRVLQQLDEQRIAIPRSEGAAVRCAVSGDPAAFAGSLERLRAAGAELPPLQLARRAAA